ncbi:MAG: hypothetical protein AB2A00_28280 [Myxococcota bacterium]
MSEMAVTVPPPVGMGRDTRARKLARENLVKVLWDRHGRRRLPTDAQLVRAMEACDKRDVWWVCEANSAGPLYFLPTKDWIRTLARTLKDWEIRSVLEVGAGDGFVSACLAAAMPDVKVVATDSGAWERPAARMNRQDRRDFKGVPFRGISAGENVIRMDAVAAVKRFKPNLTLVVWPPPGDLLERVIKAPSSRVVLDVSVEGDVCGMGMLTWRFNKDFVFGPLEERALCRLDARPREERHTRVTVYYGRAHPEFHEEKGRFR